MFGSWLTSRCIGRYFKHKVEVNPLSVLMPELETKLMAVSAAWVPLSVPLARALVTEIANSHRVTRRTGLSFTRGILRG